MGRGFAAVGTVILKEEEEGVEEVEVEEVEEETVVLNEEGESRF